jgi:hypothetical protein
VPGWVQHPLFSHLQVAVASPPHKRQTVKKVFATERVREEKIGALLMGISMAALWNKQLRHLVAIKILCLPPFKFLTRLANFVF